jgi:hypothetical protein
MILSLRKGAKLEMQKASNNSDVADFALELEPNSLLLFSEESRFDWRHRVMPTAGIENVQVGEVARISVVFGVQ